jgi:hypothetical protein
MVGTFAGCCARAESGHAAALPRSPINLRRLMTILAILTVENLAQQSAAQVIQLRVDELLPDEPNERVSNFQDHSLIGPCLREVPFVLNQREGGSYPSSSLGLTAFQRYAAQRAETCSADAGSRREGAEVAVKTYENCFIHFSYCRDQWVWRVRRKLPAKQNHLMASLRKDATNRTWDAMIDEELNLAPHSTMRQNSPVSAPVPREGWPP